MIGRQSPRPSTSETLRGFDAFELRLGDLMRGERATLGKSLIDVQRELKIKAAYVAAIENADPSAFDTPGFIAGYVRSYSRYLGLDPEWAWETFCREAGFESPHGLSSAASAPKPVRRTGLDALGDPNAAFVPRRESVFAEIELKAVGSVLVLIALIGAVGYGAWSVLQEVQRVQLTPLDEAPGIVAEPEFAASAPEVDTILTGGRGPAPVDALDRLYRPPALDVPVLVARDGPIAAVEPGSVGALAEDGPEVLAIATPEPEPAEAVPGPQVVADEAPEVNLLAVRPAWVQVTAADGTVLFEKILEPGERWVVPVTEEPPFLKTGNAGATYFEINGNAFGPVAEGGQVVRDVVLSAASLSETFAPADAASDPGLSDIAPASVAEAPPSR